MADTTNRIAGTAKFKVDGVQYMLEGKLEYSTALVKRETKSGQDTVHGYAETPVAPYIAGTFRAASNVNTQALNGITNSTVSCALANGINVIGRNMWQVGEEIKVDTTEGTFELRFEGLQGSVVED
ncbi:phage tail tube protein [Paraburkholderia silviterrae]|uniref:Phage tail protein n=1 Tax=Paraburkholderia silviterrae TaxID=2528715 RepID=A0A4V2ZZ10_9BURK|nr:phage tail tube protein [Paraburkholderia silviterrae]TDG23218.1 phage tail protein [Paraburkholderia silviterrae]